jgi:surface polysaccharide O-acyltransferase-like enzyme
MLIDNELSKRIRSLRFLLIVFVVFIHNGVISSSEIHAYELPLYAVKIGELTNTFIRIAVPLFFFISGFLLYAKEQKYIENLRKKCKTILLPYFLWISLNIIYLYIIQSLNFAKPYISGQLIIRDFSPMDFIGAFLGHFGKIYEVHHNMPLLYPLWFLRDLFVLNLLFVIIKKIIDFCPGGAFVLLFILWVSGIDIYIINNGALFFFALGYYIVKYNINYKCLDNIKKYDIVIMYMITIIISLLFREKVVIISAINIIVGIIFFIKLSYTFVKKNETYKVFEWLEQYAFWIYATHAIILSATMKLVAKIMPMNGIWLLVHYFLVTLLYISVLLCVGVIFKKLFPKLFSILTGGR